MEKTVKKHVDSEKHVKDIMKIVHIDRMDNKGQIVATMNDGKQYMIDLRKHDTLLLDMTGAELDMVPVYEGVVLKGFRKAE